jgi:hypothetical protein
METMSLSVEQAMKALKISESEIPNYIKLLNGSRDDVIRTD